MTSSIPADQETITQTPKMDTQADPHALSDPSGQSDPSGPSGSGVSVDNLDLLLDVLPPQVREALVQDSGLENLLEVVLD
jgi:hypothetical protein